MNKTIDNLIKNNIEFTEFKNGIVINADSLDVVDFLEFNHVLQDPPYGYLNHRIETFFDYKILFTKIRDRINDKGAIITFGRGDLFYEWNLFLRDLGFLHKEDCVLYKNTLSSPLLPLARYGEYYSIRALKDFAINKVKIPINDEDNISDKQVIEWIRKAFANSMYKHEVLEYLKSGIINYNQQRKSRENVTVNCNTNTASRNIYAIKSLMNGKLLSNVLHASREKLPKKWSHPTIKPIKEIAYLIKAISIENQIILDPFLGSGTTAISCINTGRRFIGIELDKEYYRMACERIREREDEYLF